MTAKPSTNDSRAIVAAALILALIAGAGVVTERAASGKQVFNTPRGQAENVQFTQVSGGVIQVTYDLVSDDPRAVFSVNLEASDDGGQTYNLRPRTISGDIGQNIRPGPGKKIVWEAGKDVETLRVDQFRFRVNPVAGRATPTTPARTGRLLVRTTPDAATVFLDGDTRGLTPMTISDVPEGEHVLTVRKAGFLENRTTVQVRGNASDTVTIVLTPANGAALGPTGEPRAAADSGGGGGILKWVLLGGGGAAVAGVLAGKKESGGGGGVTTTTVGSSTTTTVSGGSSTTTSVGVTRFTLSGRVTDDNGGAAIQGAEPTILDGPNAGRYPVTSSNGNYSIPNLPAGSFRIEFRALNYDLSPAQTVTITNGDTVHNRTMSLSFPRADFNQSTCTANGTATTTGLDCSVDGGPSQGKIDSYTWSYQGGGGSDQRHSMQMPCGGRPIGNNSVPVTLTVRNRSGADTLTKNVTINKIAGCW